MVGRRPEKRPVRIGNVSGATGDAPDAFARMVRSGNVDIITGDYLSEMNIAWNAIEKASDSDLGYEKGFLTQLTECIDEVVEKRIRVVSNAGALNAPSLSRKVVELSRHRGHSGLIVATVLGDDIGELVTASLQNGSVSNFRHLDHPELSLLDWNLKPTSAVAYIGAWGIVAALEAGADIVICGRVTDASPVIGAAAWWHGWTQTSYNELAGALVAGHLIECGSYAVGANFSGFKEFLPELVDIGFPIAEISFDGTCMISKPPSMNGVVNKFTITAQLLYELQGQMYLNPDVVADISTVRINESDTANCVVVSGTQGHPPPPSTKVMVAAPAGYQAETTYYINGLDVEAKVNMMKKQLTRVFSGSKLCKFSVELYGRQIENPSSQQEGTAMLRVFAQAREKHDLNFKAPVYALRMQSYPGVLTSARSPDRALLIDYMSCIGYHMSLDFRTMDPKPFMEMFPTLLPLTEIQHQVSIFGQDHVVDIEPPRETAQYPVLRPSYETAHPVELASYGACVSAPLGSIVHARSGDKANNSNIGFFVRSADEYPWLQTFLTVAKLQDLLGKDYRGQRIERVEFPLIWAVHFRILDFLDGGIASSARIDGLGKGVAEYLRAKVVEVPQKFLERGWI